MNRQELIDRIAADTGLTKTASDTALRSVLDAIGETLAAGGNVVLVGFGTFSVKERAERTGRNPQTGEPITIAAAKKATFKPGKELNERMNGGAR